MLSYLLICAALFVGCVATSEIGLSALGMALFPIPVAVYLLRGRVDRSLGLVACAALGGFFAAGASAAPLYYGVMAAVGLPLGIGIYRRWTYGWIVTLVTGVACVLILCSILGAWPRWLAQNRAMLDALIAGWELQTEKTTDDRAALLVQNLTWIREHWPEIGLGLLFCQIVSGACIGLSATSAWIRRQYGMVGPRGRFRDMRPTEWLVWGAILLAVLWFVDNQRPGGLLRIITWNSAIGVAAIYGLNGLSILAYAFAIIRPHVIVGMAVVVLLMSFGAFPVLCFVGLFDTWGDFRRACDKLAAARNSPQPPHDNAK